MGLLRILPSLATPITVEMPLPACLYTVMKTVVKNSKSNLPCGVYNGEYRNEARLLGLLRAQPKCTSGCAHAHTGKARGFF